jgi:hypothetical protein
VGEKNGPARGDALAWWSRAGPAVVDMYSIFQTYHLKNLIEVYCTSESSGLANGVYET